MIKVSVVVAVYNAEKYLQESLNSIFNQTLNQKNEMEIIIVNDGSKDSSQEMIQRIIKQYHAEHSDLVKLINKQNEGTFLSRFDGMSVARGAYVGFMDSDDICRPEMYEKLYSDAIESGSDIVDCDYETFEIDTEHAQESKICSQGLEKRKLIPVTDVLESTYYVHTDCVLWQRLYKHEVIEHAVDYIKNLPDYRIRFKGIRNEDNYIFPLFLFNSKTYFRTGQKLHYYRMMSDYSIMKAIKTDFEQKIQHYVVILKAGKFAYEMVEKYGYQDNEKLIMAINEYIYWQIRGLFEIFLKNPIKNRQYLKRYQEVFQKDKAIELIHCYIKNHSDMKFKSRFYHMIFILSCNLFT